MANIEHLQTIHKPANIVYDALTTAKGLSEVWTQQLTVEDHKVGAVNDFHFGDDDLTKMQVIELDAPNRVVWKCTESDPEWVDTLISFDLREKSGTTNITLKHTDWKEVTDFYRVCNYNWAMFLYSLKSYCEDGSGMPYQRRQF